MEDVMIEKAAVSAPRNGTVADLERAGLNAEQIGRVQALRARYHPLIEQVETNRQWEQLQFLRWLYQEGHQPRD
jgi:hypothetical protein